MQIGQYDWAMLSLWRGLVGRKKMTIMVPGHKAGSTLRFIRRSACRSEGERACASWRPEGREITQADLDAPHGQQDWRPCKDCRAPMVSLEDVSTALFGSHQGELAQSERVLDFWMYGERPMNPRVFKRMVVGALAQRWLSWEQAVTAMHQVVVLEAVTSAQKRLFNKIRRRTVSTELSMKELELAIEKEIERVWHEMEARGGAALSQVSLRPHDEMALATNLPHGTGIDGLRPTNRS